MRLLSLARPIRAHLLLAVLAGAAATGCGVAVLAISGFLVGRASQHPSIVAIAVAIVAVRAFSVGRGVFRYAERVASQDTAFRTLADVRVSIFSRLERLAPAGLRSFRSGELVARFVSYVDATQDLLIRGIVPPVTAALVGAGAVAATLLVFAPAAGLLAAALVLAATAIPVIVIAADSRSRRRTAPDRGELAASLTTMLGGAAGLTALLSGLALWGVLVLAVAATGSGALGRVPLAVVILTALASFDAVSPLAGAALQLCHARTSAGRIGTVIDTPEPVTDPVVPRPLPSGPISHSDPKRAGSIHG